MGNANTGTRNRSVEEGRQAPLERSRLPKRIILVRHGESEANVDKSVYLTIPDHRFHLTDKGREQTKKAGELIRDLVSDDGEVYFYVSPYARTRETLEQIKAAFSGSSDVIVGVREDCRVREMNYGNYQDPVKMVELKKERGKYGVFFYRFPGGESAAEVCDRAASFVDSLWRDIDMDRIPRGSKKELNLVIVSHGMTVRALLMGFYKWTAEQVDKLVSPGNAEFQIMELGYGGQYSLAVHHDDQTLARWGLSSDMIADQKLKAYGPKVN